MALTKCNDPMENLPGLAGGTGIDIPLIEDESRGFAIIATYFKKIFGTLDQKSCSKLAATPATMVRPFKGSLD